MGKPLKKGRKALLFLCLFLGDVLGADHLKSKLDNQGWVWYTVEDGRAIARGRMWASCVGWTGLGH